MIRLLGEENMSLEKYQEKRNFDKSSEPKGNIINKDEKENNGEEKKKCTIFVIQEHHASHLHWDLRLEIDGVLKSWAVPKDPWDINKGIKRLAIEVEDHPLEYATFEGIIPEGMYGAGTVKIWDKGEFVLENMIGNKVTFLLAGEKMRGRYALIKTPRMGKNSWLFFKI